MLNDKKYIVFESSLDCLMKFCQQCGSPIIEKEMRQNGSMIAYDVTCHSGCMYTWHSQPHVTPQLSCGNLLISAATVISGNSFSGIEAFGEAMNLQLISDTSHQNHKNEEVFPVIQDEWEKERKKVVKEMKVKESFFLAGDARMDSPGHNASYGSYTLMDTDGNGLNGSRKIVAMELGHVSEVANSNHLEPTGLVRCLNKIKDDELRVPMIATDRHVTVRSIMQNQFSDIAHQFDLWHLIKAVLKKLWAKARTAACKDLAKWIQIIANHLWWCAAACNGDLKLLLEMWRSMLHHVTNRHTWTGNVTFHKCTHARLPATQERKTKWLKKTSEAYKALHEIVNDNRLKKDFSNITKFCHT